MTTTLAPGPGDPTRPASPRELAFLTTELRHWADQGLLGEDQAVAILGRYRASRSFTLATLVLTLGACFVGVGLIWLVAANLHRFAPGGRLAIVGGFWLVATALAEWLARQRTHRGVTRSPVVGALRLLAALAFGATVFQAAQVRGMAGDRPVLIGIWAAGALGYAYLTSALMPLLLGLGLASFWFVWQVVDAQSSPVGAALALLAGGLVAVSVAVWHERWRPTFAAPWREAGAAVLLIGLFVSAIPEITYERFAWSTPLTIGCVVAVLAALSALTIGAGRSRWEPLAALGIAALGTLLAFWEPGTRGGPLTAGDWAHAGVAVIGYVLAAAAVAAAAVLRDSWRLTAVALVALVIFTTFQSFAVFARIIEGAWLFVILGLVFLATGFLADRARRQLAQSLDD